MSLINAPVAEAAAVETPVVADPAVAAVAAVPAAPSVEAPAQVTPVRPDGVPDAYWDAATGLKSTEALARLGELETADAARREGVPTDAAGYKLELAEPILDPTTKQPISFNAEDPLAKGATAWAHENGVSQAGLSKLLGLFAANEMTALAAHNESVAAETAKLGANSDARFDALGKAFTAHAGAEGAKAIMSSLTSAAAVEALEKVIKAIAGPAIGSPPVAADSSTNADLSGVDLLSAIRAKG